MVRSIGEAVDIIGTPDSHDCNCIIVEDRRYVFGGELVGCVGDQETSFPNSTVAHDYTPNEGILSQW